MRLSHLFNLVCVAIISYNLGARNQEKKDIEACQDALTKTLSELKKHFKKQEGFQFKELKFRTREEAEDVLSHITTAMELYGVVTLADVKDLIGVQSTYADNKYGWTDLKGARISNVSHYMSRYILSLPNMRLLK